MTANTENFDRWIRSDFVLLNTKLEELYFASDDPQNVEGTGEDIKQQLVEDGKAFIVELLKEGNTDEGFDAGFDLLGNVGFYMAACRRHEITEPSRERTSPLVEASALAMQLGASLGVTPRFATSHLSTHNLAIDGQYKCFTSLEDERSYTRVWMAPATGGEAVPLTAEKKSASSPQWSPDGRYLSFMAARDGGRSQVWGMDRRGGEAFPLNTGRL